MADRAVYFLHPLSNRPFCLRLARFSSESEEMLYARLLYLTWYSAEINVSAIKSNVAAHFIHERPANREVASDEFSACETVPRKLHARQGAHVNCRIATTNGFVPTWLIELQTRNDGSIHGRIFHPKAGDAFQWCCLSYCWGGNQRIKLLNANIPELSKQLLPDLPHTIRDAIIVANYMGLKYLWIDALCIV